MTQEALPTVFVSGGRRLQARVHRPPGPPRGALVVAHPHPAHGGDMEHPVVVAVAARAADRGLLALRFDFGGVGQSEGRVEDRAGHVEDVRRALLETRRRAPGGPLVGAGFSYGARMTVLAAEGGEGEVPPLAGLLLLAPATRIPRTRRDFANLLLGRPLGEAAADPEAVAALGRVERPLRVIVGSDDVVAPEADLRAALRDPADLEVLPGLNHFFARGRGGGPLAEDVFLPAVDRALDLFRVRPRSSTGPVP